MAIMIEVEGTLEDVLAEVFRKRVCPMLEYYPAQRVRLVVSTEPHRFRGGNGAGNNFFNNGDPGRSPEFTWQAAGLFHDVVHQFRFDFLGNLDARALESYILFGIYQGDGPAIAGAPAEQTQPQPGTVRIPPHSLTSPVAVVSMAEIAPAPLQVVSEGGTQRLAESFAAPAPEPERIAEVIDAATPVPLSPNELSDAEDEEVEVPEDLYQPLPSAHIAPFPAVEEPSPDPRPWVADVAFLPPAGLPVAPAPLETAMLPAEAEAEAEAHEAAPEMDPWAEDAPRSDEDEKPALEEEASAASLVDEVSLASYLASAWLDLQNPEEEPEAQLDDLPRPYHAWSPEKDLPSASENRPQWDEIPLTPHQSQLPPPSPASPPPPPPQEEEEIPVQPQLQEQEQAQAPSGEAEEDSVAEDVTPHRFEEEDEDFEEEPEPDPELEQEEEPPPFFEPLTLVPASAASFAPEPPLDGDTLEAITGRRPDVLPGNLYQDFFDFEVMPFNNTPDTQFYFPTRRHQEALARLFYAISERKGFVLLTGEIGCGKSTLCRELICRLPADIKTALITQTHLSPTQLLRAIAEDLGLPAYGRSRYEILQLLNQYLIEQLAAGATVCIIIDEAQNLDAETLEEVRMISNLETEQEKLVQIILLGQPELRQKIEQPELRQLRQRIAVQYHLESLSVSETVMYIRHRLKVAAPRHPLEFKRSAMLEAHRFSGGVPRLINNLCDNALLTAFTRGKRTISSSLIHEAARDLRLAPHYSRLARLFRFD